MTVEAKTKILSLAKVILIACVSTALYACGGGGGGDSGGGGNNTPTDQLQSATVISVPDVTGGQTALLEYTITYKDTNSGNRQNGFAHAKKAGDNTAITIDSITLPKSNAVNLRVASVNNSGGNICEPGKTTLSLGESCKVFFTAQSTASPESGASNVNVNVTVAGKTNGDGSTRSVQVPVQFAVNGSNRATALVSPQYNVIAPGNTITLRVFNTAPATGKLNINNLALSLQGPLAGAVIDTDNSTCSALDLTGLAPHNSCTYQFTVPSGATFTAAQINDMLGNATKGGVVSLTAANLDTTTGTVNPQLSVDSTANVGGVSVTYSYDTNPDVSYALYPTGIISIAAGHHIDLVVKNTGSTALDGFAMDLVGQNGSQTLDCHGTIEPDNACTVTISAAQISPDETGSAVLDISSTGAGYHLPFVANVYKTPDTATLALFSTPAWVSNASKGVSYVNAAAGLAVPREPVDGNANVHLPIQSGSSKTFYLTNIGAKNASSLSIVNNNLNSDGGGNAIVSNDCGTSLAADGGYCGITLTANGNTASAGNYPAGNITATALSAATASAQLRARAVNMKAADVAANNSPLQLGATANQSGHIVVFSGETPYPGNEVTNGGTVTFGDNKVPYLLIYNSGATAIDNFDVYINSALTVATGVTSSCTYTTSDGTTGNPALNTLAPGQGCILRLQGNTATTDYNLIRPYGGIRITGTSDGNPVDNDGYSVNVRMNTTGTSASRGYLSAYDSRVSGPTELLDGTVWNVNAGIAAQRKLIVKNTGANAITDLNMATTLPSSAVTSTCGDAQSPITLAAGASCEITVNTQGLSNDVSGSVTLSGDTTDASNNLRTDDYRIGVHIAQDASNGQFTVYRQAGDDTAQIPAGKTVVVTHGATTTLFVKNTGRGNIPQALITMPATLYQHLDANNTTCAIEGHAGGTETINAGRVCTLAFTDDLADSDAPIDGTITLAASNVGNSGTRIKVHLVPQGKGHLTLYDNYVVPGAQLSAGSTVYLFADKHRAIIVKNTGSAPVTGVNMTGNGNASSFNKGTCNAVTLNPGDVCVATINLTSNALSSDISGTIAVAADNADNVSTDNAAVFYTRRYNDTAHVVAYDSIGGDQAYVLPTVPATTGVYLASQSTAPRTITVRNVGTVPMTSFSIDSNLESDKNYSLSGSCRNDGITELLPGQYCQVTIKPTPSGVAPDLLDGALMIDGSHADNTVPGGGLPYLIPVLQINQKPSFALYDAAGSDTDADTRLLPSRFLGNDTLFVLGDNNMNFKLLNNGSAPVDGIMVQPSLFATLSGTCLNGSLAKGATCNFSVTSTGSTSGAPSPAVIYTAPSSLDSAVNNPYKINFGNTSDRPDLVVYAADSDMPNRFEPALALPHSGNTIYIRPNATRKLIVRNTGSVSADVNIFQLLNNAVANVEVTSGNCQLGANPPGQRLFTLAAGASCTVTFTGDTTSSNATNTFSINYTGQNNIGTVYSDSFQLQSTDNTDWPLLLRENTALGNQVLPDSGSVTMYPNFGRTLVLQNMSSANFKVPTISVSDESNCSTETSTHYSVANDNCSDKSLVPGQSCTFTVQASSSATSGVDATLCLGGESGKHYTLRGQNALVSTLRAGIHAQEVPTVEIPDMHVNAKPGMTLGLDSIINSDTGNIVPSPQGPQAFSGDITYYEMCQLYASGEVWYCMYPENNGDSTLWINGDDKTASTIVINEAGKITGSLPTKINENNKIYYLGIVACNASGCSKDVPNNVAKLNLDVSLGEAPVGKHKLVEAYGTQGCALNNNSGTCSTPTFGQYNIAEDFTYPSSSEADATYRLCQWNSGTSSFDCSNTDDHAMIDGLSMCNTNGGCGNDIAKGDIQGTFTDDSSLINAIHYYVIQACVPSTTSEGVELCNDIAVSDCETNDTAPGSNCKTPYVKFASLTLPKAGGDHTLTGIRGANLKKNCTGDDCEFNIFTTGGGTGMVTPDNPDLYGSVQLCTDDKGTSCGISNQNGLDIDAAGNVTGQIYWTPKTQTNNPYSVYVQATNLAGQTITGDLPIIKGTATISAPLALTAWNGGGKGDCAKGQCQIDSGARYGDAVSTPYTTGSLACGVNGNCQHQAFKAQGNDISSYKLCMENNGALVCNQRQFMSDPMQGYFTPAESKWGWLGDGQDPFSMNELPLAISMIADTGVLSGHYVKRYSNENGSTVSSPINYQFDTFNKLYLVACTTVDGGELCNDGDYSNTQAGTWPQVTGFNALQDVAAVQCPSASAVETFFEKHSQYPTGFNNDNNTGYLAVSTVACGDACDNLGGNKNWSDNGETVYFMPATQDMYSASSNKYTDDDGGKPFPWQQNLKQVMLQRVSLGTSKPLNHYTPTLYCTYSADNASGNAIDDITFMSNGTNPIRPQNGSDAPAGGTRIMPITSQLNSVFNSNSDYTFALTYHPRTLSHDADETHNDWYQCGNSTYQTNLATYDLSGAPITPNDTSESGDWCRIMGIPATDSSQYRTFPSSSVVKDDVLTLQVTGGQSTGSNGNALKNAFMRMAAVSNGGNGINGTANHCLDSEGYVGNALIMTLGLVDRSDNTKNDAYDTTYIDNMTSSGSVNSKYATLYIQGKAYYTVNGGNDWCAGNNYASKACDNSLSTINVPLNCNSNGKAYVVVSASIPYGITCNKDLSSTECNAFFSTNSDKSPPLWPVKGICTSNSVVYEVDC